MSLIIEINAIAEKLWQGKRDENGPVVDCSNIAEWREHQRQTAEKMDNGTFDLNEKKIIDPDIDEKS